MPKAENKPEACSSCKNKHYLLFNEGGRVHGRLCECFHCAECGGDGKIVTQDERGITFIATCRCAIMRKRLLLLSDAGIPGKFADAEFDNFKRAHQSQGTAKRVAMDFVSDYAAASERKPPRGLVFMGEPGIGKTHLMVAILKQLILEHGVDGRFVDFFQLLADIRHGYSEDMSDQAIIRPYLRSSVLVIDELAKGRNTEWELTVLDEFISSRYNADDKVTLFTTNYASEMPLKVENAATVRPGLTDTSGADFAKAHARETLGEKVGSRIYSRLAEMCDFRMIQGQDFRQKKLSDTQKYPRRPASRREQ